MILDKLLDFVYPPCCGFCEKENKEYLCDSCKRKIEVENRIKGKNKKGRKEDFYDEILWGFSYKGMLRNKIIAYKFQEQSYLYHTFSTLLLKNKKIYQFLLKYDTILPVPMERKKELLRGFNPTYLIAKELERHIEGLLLEKNCLVKLRKTLPQSSLNRKERQKNLENAFSVRQAEKIENKKVLLFDDVYTTGATVRECSKMLKEAGVKKLGILTLAKD